MTDVLARICADKRRHVAECQARTPAGELERLAALQPPARGFRACLAAKAARNEYGLICEIKKASPSKGLIRADFDPPTLARAYRDGGATCLSVLTDTPYFQGRDDDLRTARGAVDLPILRKDFMLDPYQVIEARAMGADCILIIMAAVDDALAAELQKLAAMLGMDALIEVHDGEEMQRAIRLQPKLIGINNRNLKTLRVDLETTEILAPMAPPESLLVAESGLSTPADLARMARIGVRCFLIGESLMREPDVAAATRRLARPQPAQASA